MRSLVVILTILNVTACGRSPRRLDIPPSPNTAPSQDDSAEQNPAPGSSHRGLSYDPDGSDEERTTPSTMDVKNKTVIADALRHFYLTYYIRLRIQQAPFAERQMAFANISAAVKELDAGALENRDYEQIFLGNKSLDTDPDGTVTVARRATSDAMKLHLRRQSETVSTTR